MLLHLEWVASGLSDDAPSAELYRFSSPVSAVSKTRRESGNGAARGSMWMHCTGGLTRVAQTISTRSTLTSGASRGPDV